jgi:glutathione S-transferase
MITLHHFWDSFCSFKVRMALAEKGLKWDGEHVDLMRFENLRPEYLAINPNGLVPTLIDDGDTIFESSIINEYLEDRYPQNPLCPDNPAARARMRYWVKHEEDELFIAVRPASLNLMMKQVFDRYSDNELDAFLVHHPRPHLIPRLKKMFRAPFEPTAVGASRKRLRSAFKKMDSRLGFSPWLAGNSYSLADIAAAPVIDRVTRLGFQDLWADLPNMADWIERLTGRPAYTAAQPNDEFRMPAPKAGDALEANASGY